MAAVAVVIDIHHQEVLVVIAQLRMGQEIVLGIKKEGSDDQKSSQGKLEDDQTLPQVVLSSEPRDALVEGVHGLEGREDQCGIEAGDKTTGERFAMPVTVKS